MTTTNTTPAPVQKGDVLIHPVYGDMGQVYAIDYSTRMVGVQWMNHLRTALTFEAAAAANKA